MLFTDKVFSRHHRKARLLFGLSDVLLTALAFEAAYQTRQFLPFQHLFYIEVPAKALLLGFSSIVWLTLGYWLDIYDRLDSAHPRVIVRDTFRQCVLGAVALVLFEFLLRLDLSRVFLLSFAVYSWILLCLFRWKAGRLVGIIRREFAAPHFVMVVGTGRRARRIGQLLEQSATYGIRLVGFLCDGEDPGIQSVSLDSEYPVSALRELPSILCENVIDELIFVVDSQRLAELE